MKIQYTCDTSVKNATETILGYIHYQNQRVIYFHGWSGLGASAVLRSVAEALFSRRYIPGLCFDRIILIDCSEWKSRRSMQRTIAEKLKLDPSTMTILDRQDEEDDFRGVAENSRREILSVSRKINYTLKDNRYAVVFYNGSDTEIDLSDFGITSFDLFSNNILLWTFTRSSLTIKEYDDELVHKLRITRFLAYDRTEHLRCEMLYGLLCQEAAIIAAGMDPTMVADCCLYKLFLHVSFPITIKYNWAGHASNIWICDGILHEDSEREISNALSRSLECNASLLDDVLRKFKTHLRLPFLRIKDDDIYEEGPYRWISITSKDTKLHGMKIVPAQTSSFILEFDRYEPPLALIKCMFEHSSNLCVLILCCCSFNFTSPPFLPCRSLKFLGLDHCSHEKMYEPEDKSEWACLYSLLVLDLRYTDWNEMLSQENIDLMTNIRELTIEGFMCWKYTPRLQWRLPNLERLRIMTATQEPKISTYSSNSFLSNRKLEILDFSGNSDMENLPSSLSEMCSLEVLVLDGCTKLEDVVPDMLPHLLRSFRLDAYGPPTGRIPDVEQPMDQSSPSIAGDKKGANSISKISLKGCRHLDDLLLRGLPNIVELDLSGSAIKVLDFEIMVVEVPSLKRLFLLGCEHLRAIIWGNIENGIQPDLELLCIDTRAGPVRPWLSLGQNKPLRLQVYAVVDDARFAWSLYPPIAAARKGKVYFNICFTTSLMHSDQVSVQRSIQASEYIDVLTVVSDAPRMEDFPEPPTTLDRHIEIAEGSRGLKSALHGYPWPNNNDLPHIMSQFAVSLHVHDVSVSGSMPWGFWIRLKQCCMERCPKLDTVFPPGAHEFRRMKTFWALDLLMARQIWSKGLRSRTSSFTNLQHLHLSSCPRLQFVLAVWISSFPNLETLHVIHCGELKHIFVLDEQYPEIDTNGVAFPKLTTIHLHDLPALRQISERKMVAPKLETIKIRGCWSLRRLPVVEARGPGVKKPIIEIEKDVWDALKWDGAEAGHHPSHFEEPVHSRHYKKKLPMTSILR